ncbi:MAG: hypothetical protein Q8K99_09005 [Actinomycetota bacterium]|nr:hypothetical protein [Actinomycetota bacterium]
MESSARKFVFALLALALVAVLGIALLANRSRSETSRAANPAESTATDVGSTSAESDMPQDKTAHRDGEPAAPTSPGDSPGRTPVPETTILALVTDVIVSGARVEIVIDPIEMYPIDENAPPAPNDPSANVVYNDVKESVRYLVDPNALVMDRGDPPGTIAVSEWVGTAASDTHAYWLGILSGNVVRIEEQPIP